MHPTTALVAALAAGAAAASYAPAGIVSVAGSVEWIAQPADARLNALTHNTKARVWDEGQRVSLDGTLIVNAIAPGLYDDLSDLGEYMISPEGYESVSSHYIHFDSEGSKSASARGSVTFDADIVGVIAINTSGDRHLDNSDYLGDPTLFSRNVNARGLEWNTDSFVISNDRRTISFDFRISSPGDFMRVLTVPSPGALALAGFGGLLCLRRRK